MRTPQQMASMTCPVDGTVLVMSDRQGIEIDYSPAGRGVWLDRGEIDKIIERSAPAQTPASVVTGIPRHERGDYRDKHHYKRKSLLAELFD
jgi:Zn-finger nucleic acid-binding protein